MPERSPYPLPVSVKKRRADGKAQTRRPQKRRTGKQQAARIAKVLAIVGVVGALALAFGLAFGLGGRDVAAQLTQRWYEQSQTAAEKVRSHVDSEPAATRATTGEGPAATPRPSDGTAPAS